MTSKGRHKRLAQFGAEVLAIMEASEDWNSDTWQAVQDAAVNRGLANDQAAMFTRTEEGKL